MGRFLSRKNLAALVLTGSVAAALGACSSASAAPGSPAAASVAPVLTGAADGQVLFEQSCASCHGVAGVGSKFTMDNNTIEVPAITFADLSGTYGDKLDTLVPDSITKGLDETGQPLNRMMPRWTIFSDQQVTDIVAYLKGLK
ncbi:MAG: c-type cytochrome [Candidatus Limnocylindrales bacterium]